MNTIPKICYLYWNKAPMSMLHVITVFSFYRYNPDWEIIVYVTKQSYEELDKDIQEPIYSKYTGKDYFYMIKRLNYVEIRELDITKSDKHSILISDIWRREILYKTGGMYLDFDNIWLKPMSEFVNIDCIGNPNNFEALVCFYGYTNDFHNVSNLIAEPCSSYIYSLIKEQIKVKAPYHDQSFGTTMLNKKYPNLSSIIDKYPRILAVKYETFYPYCTLNLKQLYKMNDLTPLDNKNVMGIHWFSGNELSKEYINDNGFKRECSMTSILKKEGYI